MKPLTAQDIADLRSNCKYINEGRAGFCDPGMLRALKVEPLLDEVERSRALLKRIEWVEFVDGEARSCPTCRGYEGDGHTSGCELAALLT